MKIRMIIAAALALICTQAFAEPFGLNSLLPKKRLFAEDESSTSQAAAMRAQFGGKRVKWSGKVNSVLRGKTTIAGHEPSTIVVKMDGMDVFVDVRKTSETEAKALRSGQRIAFSGILQKKGPGLKLTDSVLE